VLRVFCSQLRTPHTKFCIIIHYDECRFLFINSEPPEFRKARALAVEVGAQEALFLRKISYIDTTKIENLRPIEHEIHKAAKTKEHCLGMILPAVRHRIQAMVESHKNLTEQERSWILEGYPSAPIAASGALI
jgi:hypothetical protein